MENINHLKEVDLASQSSSSSVNIDKNNNFNSANKIDSIATNQIMSNPMQLLQNLQGGNSTQIMQDLQGKSGVDISKAYGLFMSNMMTGKPLDMDALREAVDYDSLDSDKQELIDTGLKSITSMTSGFGQIAQQLQSNIQKLMSGPDEELNIESDDDDDIDLELNQMLNEVEIDDTEAKIAKLNDAAAREFFSDPGNKDQMLKSLEMVKSMLPDFSQIKSTDSVDSTDPMELLELD